MFQFRFQSLIQLRENERDVARSALAEAFHAMAQIDAQIESLHQARRELDIETLQHRIGGVSVDRLLSQGRYERQLAADLAQLEATKSKVEVEVERRKTVLTETNAGVRQLELLRDKEREQWTLTQQKSAQLNLDEVAAQRHARMTRLSRTVDTILESERWQ